MDNNLQKYDKIAIVLNVAISEDDENILEGKEKNEEVLNSNTGRRTAKHNSNNKENKNYLLWPHDQT